MQPYVPLIAATIGILAGAAGYWIATFWMKPLIMFLELKNKILADLVYFANVVNADHMNEEFQKRHIERGVAFRRHAAQLTASMHELPRWYLWRLKRSNHNLQGGIDALIGLSNTFEFDAARATERHVRKALRIGSLTDDLDESAT